MEKLPIVIMSVVALVAIIGLVRVLAGDGISGKVVSTLTPSQMVPTGQASSYASDISTSGSAYRESIGACPRADADPNAQFIRVLPIYTCQEYCNVATEPGVGYALKSICTFDDPAMRDKCQAYCGALPSRGG